MAEATYVQDGCIIQQVTTAAVAAGEVIQLKDGRAGVSVDAYAAGAIGNFQVTGIHTVAKVITQTMLVSNQVYWDTSASTCNLLGSGSSDFFIGTVVEDAAYAETTVKVNLNVKPAYKLSLADGFASLPVSTAGWPHVVGGGNGVGMIFDLATEAQKLDALSLNAVATSTPGVLQFKVAIVDVGDDAALDLNIGLADATHATDADQITSSMFLHVDGNALSLAFESDNAAAEVAATDSTIDAVASTPFLVTMDLRDWADIQVYVNGLLVCDGVTGTSRTFTLAGVAGPLKLLAHLEKSANNTPGNVVVMDMGFTSFDV